MDSPKISCLCVTFDRPEFAPFLLWNFHKQTYPDRQLVVIDGSPRFQGEAFAEHGVRYFHVTGLSSIPEKRNLALAKAEGELITWFDDDDWQHAEKCAILCGMLKSGLSYAGGRMSLFFNLYSGAASEYRSAFRILFNAIGVRTEVARATSFDEKVLKASDTGWLARIQGNVSPPETVFMRHALFCCLCHGKNISNPAASHRRQDGVPTLDAQLGGERESFMGHVRAIRKTHTGSEGPLSEARSFSARR